MIQKGHMSCGKDKGMMKALNLNGVRFPQWDSFTIQSFLVRANKWKTKIHLENMASHLRALQLAEPMDILGSEMKSISVSVLLQSPEVLKFLGS